MDKVKLYWLCQIGGWLFFNIIEIVSYGNVFGFNKLLFLNGFLNMVVGIILTHSYRSIVLKFNLLKLPSAKLIPRALVLLIFISVLLSFFNVWLDRLTVPSISNLPIGFVLVWGYMFNWSKYILMWALIYHLFQYWEKSLETERDKYRLEATLKENEYNNLKTQLNPHFLFNSLNGIRTLVDLNPASAKEAITRLSNLLRSSLQMNQYKTVSLRQELETVKDYLAIEKIRFDERLQVNYSIEPNTLEVQVPPMMLQTIVENCVKHGISNIIKGGQILIKTFVENDFLFIEIVNSGQFNPKYNQQSDGFGISNTIERLRLLFGENAKFDIQNANINEVKTTIKLPL
jgi:two-component system, LytTR family, sensor kinase